jgi:endonuclease III
MAESLAQLKKKMREVMASMKKRYGATKLPRKEPGVDLLVYLVLREGWDFRKANRCVKILEDTFVDWNEIRVSFPRELAEATAFLQYDKLYEKIHRFKDVLKEVFQEYNRINLDFLREADFEETRHIFASIEALGKANAYIFLQCLRNELEEVVGDGSETLVMSTESLRVGIRLGLIKKTSSHNVGRKAFTKLLAPADYFAFQNYFVRHAESLCRSKAPLCKECFLSSICKYFSS